MQINCQVELKAKQTKAQQKTKLKRLFQLSTTIQKQKWHLIFRAQSNN